MKYLILLLLSVSAMAQSPWYYGSGKAVNLENAIQYKNGVMEITGTLDPSASAVSAPKGSRYISTTDGATYLKLDAGSSTNWLQFGPTIDKMYIGQKNKAANFGGAGTSGNTVLGLGASSGWSTSSVNVLANTCIGTDTCAAMTTTGKFTTAVGWGALKSTTTNASTAVGYAAGSNQTTGASNTWIGGNSGFTCITCTNSTAVGGNSLYTANTSSTNNTCVGYMCLYQLTSGTNTTSLGLEAGYDNTTGSSNVYLGYQAGKGLGNFSNKLVIGNVASNSLIYGDFSAGQVAINSTTLPASAAFSIPSTVKGFLPPVMTTTQKNAISSPAEGLVAYDNVTHTINFYNGSAWTSLGAAGGGLTSVNSQTGPGITLAVGTTGTDFNVATTTNTVTFHLPDSSATNRGALTAADWAIFNGKVDGQASSVDSEVALFSGTGGKTIKRATGTGVAHLTSGVLSVSNVNAATELTGTTPIANGGTNSNTALSGSSIMISNGTSVVQGAAGTTTTVLHGNASGAPTYSAVSLTADVTGITPVANGGTGLNTLTTGNVILGAGSSTPTFVAPSTSGNVLTSNGSTWTSAAAPSAGTPSQVTKTTTYTALSTDYTIFANASGGGFTITSPVSPATNQIILLKKIGTDFNTVTWSGPYEGGSNTTLNTPGESLTLQWDGSTFRKLNRDTAISAQTAVAITFTVPGGTNPTKGGTPTVDKIWLAERIGRYALIQVQYIQPTGGAAGAGGGYTLLMPSSLVIDTTETRTNTSLAAVLGGTGDAGVASYFTGNAGGASPATMSAIVYDSTHFKVGGLIGAASNIWGSGGLSLASATLNVTGWLKVPISGWNE